MAIDILDELAQLIERERDALLTVWRALVRELPAARNLDAPTLNDHIPHLLAELASALQAGSDETIAEALFDASPPAYGVQRIKDAFDIEEVVAEYNILRGCIHDLAGQNGLSMQGRPFHVLNRVLDRAIGSAVGAFATQKALEVQHRREENTNLETEVGVKLERRHFDLWPLVEALIHDLHPVAVTDST